MRQAPESVRSRVRRAEIDAGAWPGTTTEESAELKRLKRENAELRRANEILKAAAGFFAAEAGRAHYAAHRREWPDIDAPVLDGGESGTPAPGPCDESAAAVTESG